MAEKESVAELFENLCILVYKGCYVPLGVLDMMFHCPSRLYPCWL